MMLRVKVSGYGVEMAIKNMEYKAVDDRQVGAFEPCVRVFRYCYMISIPNLSV